VRMSCFRHEDDWGPPEHGSEPSAVCFRLLFGGYCAVWCDVGHGLTARDGRGLALHVVQLPAVVIRRGTIRERQTDLSGARGRHRGLPPAAARLRHLHAAGGVRIAVHAPLHAHALLRGQGTVPDRRGLLGLSDRLELPLLVRAAVRRPHIHVRAVLRGPARHLQDQRLRHRGHQAVRRTGPDRDPLLVAAAVRRVLQRVRAVPRGTARHVQDLAGVRVRERHVALRVVRHPPLLVRAAVRAAQLHVGPVGLRPAGHVQDHAVLQRGRHRVRAVLQIRRVGLRQSVQLRVRILRLDRDLDGRALAARRRGDRGPAGLRAGGDHARAHHVRDARVRARPRDLPVRRVRRAHGRRQLRGGARLQFEFPVLHTITRDRDRRDRDGGLALDRAQGRGGAVPLHDAAVVVQARLAGSRILLAAAVVEDHLRALGEVVRDHVLVQFGLLAAVGRARGGHLHARPGRVVDRGRAVARVHVRVDLAPARRLRSVDGVLRDRVRRKLTGHGHGDRRGLGPGLRGDRGLAGLPRGDHALRADGRHVLVGGTPRNGAALRIGGGGQLLRGHAIGQIHGVVALVDLHGLGRGDHAIAGLPGAG